jgi:hypothetical protein
LNRLYTCIKELSPATMKLAVGTCNYGINAFNNELVLMAMLRALPRKDSRHRGCVSG